MRPAILLIAAISLAVTISSCGGDGGPSVRILLEADLSQLPEGVDPDEAMKDVAEILERRTRAFDTGDLEIEVAGTNRLSVRLRGIGIEEARELLGKTAQLEFRKPVLDESANIVCEAEDGSEFAVPSQQVSTATVDGRRVSQCLGADAAGQVLWEPATGTDSQGVERALTGAFVRPNAEVIDDPTIVVLIELTGEGSLLFEQITTEIIGLPLGIFLDEELIGAPAVQQPITGGNATIIGLNEDEARVLAIQLNAGALPVPLTVISVEETP